MKKMILAGCLFVSGAVAAAPVAAPLTSTALEACNGTAFQTVLQAAANPELSPPEARAYWLSRQFAKWPGVPATQNFRLYYSSIGQISTATGSLVTGAEGSLALEISHAPLPAPLQRRFKFVPDGVLLAVKPADLARLPALHRQQLVLVQEDASGVVLQATRLQVAGALDDLYAAAQQADALGVSIHGQQSAFQLWAPTAQHVSLCLYPQGTGAAKLSVPMQPDAATGIWSLRQPADLSGSYYQYLVDVFVPGVGVVRNRVTDPYSISLTTDSRRSYIARLAAPNLQPKGWNKALRPGPLKAQTDMAVYELHVRDFSINDKSVSAPQRGKYLAFTEANSNGMQHLKALAQAGISDVHLLPVFDLGSVPETACLSPDMTAVAGGVDSASQQAAVVAVADRDCFNWGYDPYHYSAPEGSYASDAADGARRILEFRQMVMALHQAGLRVGMDVVYNHTFISGQNEKSVLDRIVPGYYHRLNAVGAVEQSSCCDNTATENNMMGKLMLDSVLLWATQYQIDSFRFDLMAHQPRAVMQALQGKLKSVTGRQIPLIGEGWNFGEVADGARFVQASQLSLNGSGIATFSDRGRDAVRGGAASDSGDLLISRKGYINGLANPALSRTDLMQAADMVRVGLAGTLGEYAMLTYDGTRKTLKQIDYNGQLAGYASQPGEVVNYVENHDNQTLFDINVYKLPTDTSRIDRARVQMLGAAITALSQGVAYFHAGLDVLRSKSMDRNSFNSGDWFNRLDWTYQDNYFATGLPPEPDNGKDYPLIRPLLANPLIKPTGTEIRLARDMFRDLLKIRASSSLFRLRSAAEVQQRLRFENVGPGQNAAVIVAHLDGKNYPGAHYQDIVYFINVATEPHSITLASAQGQHYQLHPVHRSAAAADRRIAASSVYEAASGRFTVPARSAVVFVQP